MTQRTRLHSGRWRVALAAVILATVPGAALAAHPKLSEDTGTQGAGNFELESGFAWSHQADDRIFQFQPQLSWGASAALDLIVQPAWIATQTGGESVRGPGDTNLDVKWRFQEGEPWTLAIRAGVTVPTAQDDLGLQRGKLAPHSILIATGDFRPYTLDANVGYAHLTADASHRADLFQFSFALTVESARHLFFVLDSALDSNPDKTQGRQLAAIGLLGVIYTIRPGLDIDAGFRSRLNATGPAQQWLLGITFRGAP